ncbi:tyrosine-protein phosphatase [Sphingomonas sp. SUN039]|uniref:tyrosine-protein phosphatase n=1 Tax=Sphingomonas sp. SUN039 TaxID=2937787 RepID=UPI002164D40A|nr:tyrosine-protein phosphatase [Sphingomonas sp. SUN039]UVO55789.1 tyrosine-protein phosphatase [Sphingomonas sp. SUN039]
MTSTTGAFWAERVKPFAGIHNFRDYGGYATADGGRLKTGALFRSGQHVGATADDLTAVAELGLGTVIDLRGNSERRDYPCTRPEGFAAEVFFFDGETAGRGGAPHVEAAREIAEAHDAHRAMVDLYAFMPFRPNLISVLRMYFAALAERDGAHLLHCLAGKDRTGLGAALLHTLMGVHRDDMMADYLLTNTAGDPEARIAAGAASIRASRGPQISDAAIRTLMSVDPAFLDAALDAIVAAHGSVEDYARDVLGVTPGRRAQIAARLIA